MMRSRPVTPFEDKVLNILEQYERQGLAKLGQPQMAAMLGVSVTQMENTLRNLRKKGYVIVHEPGRGGRNPRPQTYRLTYIPEG